MEVTANTNSKKLPMVSTTMYPRSSRRMVQYPL